VVWANASALKMNGILNLIPAGWQWEQAWPAEFQTKALAAVRCALQQGNARFSAHTLTQAGVKRHWDVGLTRTSSRGHATSLVVATAREVGPDFMDAEVLRRLENLDRLTGLPNRAWFQQELSRRTADQTGRGGPLALVMMDLDGFKQLNSSLGAQACDAMLVRFADLMVRAMGESCFFARSGGDEFALIVEGEAGAGELTARIGGLIRGCSEQISTSEQLDAFSVSAGISLFSGDAVTDQELMRNAHTALRAAKAEGRGRCVDFDGSMRQQLQKQASMLDVARARSRVTGSGLLSSPRSI
jgi:diguanylate cyclase (GGDEF)-like protein